MRTNADHTCEVFLTETFVCLKFFIFLWTSNGLGHNDLVQSSYLGHEETKKNNPDTVNCSKTHKNTPSQVEKTYLTSLTSEDPEMDSVGKVTTHPTKLLTLSCVHYHRLFWCVDRFVCQRIYLTRPTTHNLFLNPYPIFCPLKRS